ncbi:MAG: RDD family protein [Clostridia bacterium]|nr:RDD family protein [Clostridia bacterium]
MEVKSKRVIATIIDYAAIALIILLIGKIPNLPEWFWAFRFSIGKVPCSIPSIGFFALLALIVCKDFIFKNASFGKKIMGLQIKELSGSYPRMRVLIKRGVFMPTLGYSKLLISKFTFDELIKWEADYIGTVVVADSSFCK